jgi:hypothetical protein
METASVLRRVRAALTIPGISQWTGWAAPNPASMRPVPIERDLLLRLKVGDKSR